MRDRWTLGASGRESTRSPENPECSRLEAIVRELQEDRREAETGRRVPAEAGVLAGQGAVATGTREEDRPRMVRERTGCLPEDRPRLAAVAVEAAAAAGAPETEEGPAAGRRRTTAWETSKKRW